MVGYAVIELLSALSRPGDGVAHFAHLGGMLVGLLLLLYWRNGGGNSNRSHRNYYDRDYYDKGSDGGFNFRRWFSKLFTRKEEEEELNRILDKVKKSGYANLTDEEKRRLFDKSKK